MAVHPFNLPPADETMPVHDEPLAAPACSTPKVEWQEISLPDVYTERSEVAGFTYGLAITAEHENMPGHHRFRATIYCNGEAVVDMFTHYGKEKTLCMATKAIAALINQQHRKSRQRARKRAAAEAAVERW